jgi:hypothetical protein
VKTRIYFKYIDVNNLMGVEIELIGTMLVTKNLSLGVYGHIKLDSEEYKAILGDIRDNNKLK